VGAFEGKEGGGGFRGKPPAPWPSVARCVACSRDKSLVVRAQLLEEECKRLQFLNDLLLLEKAQRGEKPRFIF